MLTRDRTALVVIDVQDKLLAAMHNRDEMLRHLTGLIRGSQVLGLPVLHTEQNPRRLGPTTAAAAELLPGQAIGKLAFSAAGEPEFLQRLEGLDRRSILLAGIESHVCIYQTAMDLLGEDYDVHVVADAVSSRREDNHRQGLEMVRSAGGRITCVETALLELLGSAAAPEFKAILEIIK